MVNKGDLYACFGGFSDQYWTQLTTPNFNGNCDCLSLCRMDDTTGEMELCGQLHGLSSPSTLVISKDHKYIYCSNEEKDFKGRGNGGGITAVRLDLDNERMELINQSFAAGSSTCYVSLDKTEQYLLVANHASKFYCSRYDISDGVVKPTAVRDEGCLCLFEIRPDGGIGRILDRVVLGGTGIDPMEHASAHPHSIIIDDQDFIIAPNKGGDSIWLGKLNRESGKLEELSVYKSEFGSSPRYAFFIPGTDIVLVQNEYDGHLCSYQLDRKAGVLNRLCRIDTMDPQVSTVLEFDIVDEKMHPWGCDVQVHPNNRFVYVNNSQKIVRLFHLDPQTGALTPKATYPVEVGFMTRGMQVSPDGRFLVVTGMADEKAFIYTIDQVAGELTLSSEISLPTPTALRFIRK